MNPMQVFQMKAMFVYISSMTDELFLLASFTDKFKIIEGVHNYTSFIFPNNQH